MSRFLFLVLLMFACAPWALTADWLPFPRPSSFEPANIPRDPFTPLDELKIPEKTQVVESAGSGESQFDLRSLFNVTSISINQLAIAIINRKAFAEGESFDLRGAGKTYTVTVLKISDGSVEVDCSGARLTLLLNRPKPKSLAEKEE